VTLWIAAICGFIAAFLLGFGYGFIYALDRQRYEPPETKALRELERIYHLEER